MPNCKRSTFITRRDREIGCKIRLGDTTRNHSNLSACLKSHHTWDPIKTVRDSDHGGIFNFDFSKDGSLLGAACERKSVLLFDPFNGKLVASKTNAHTDCVNCVKFLDDRLFATCSDDTTVALWDTRYLKHNVQTFRGHSNWVKNIEYDSQQGILLTSGFDGCIYTWNINKYSSEESSNRVFYTSGLMRSKLSPDFSKLVISTHEGYIIVVHNLDLSTLGEDLKGFKPNMYRLMQRSQTPLRIGLMYNHVFEQERNKVQFIADWPTGNDASIISSLQVHPQGWCILSRNTDSSENTEWTCVHELQDEPPEKKVTKRPWEMERVTPHTSSAYCTSTNTPAYSSLAPSRQSRPHHPSTNENQSDNTTSQSSSGSSTNTANQSSAQNTNDQLNESINNSQVSASANNLPAIGSNSSDQRVSRRDTSSPDANSLDETFRPSPVEISGVSQSSPNTSQPERHAPVSPQAAGPIHNSLIQIRRGARQEDGSFSFSISVHTSSGRTIEFNQDDLASDDEDNGIRIERIIPSGRSDLGQVNLSSGSSQPVSEENISLTQNDTVSASARGTVTRGNRESLNHNRASTSAAVDNAHDRESFSTERDRRRTSRLGRRGFYQHDEEASDSDSDFDSIPLPSFDNRPEDYSDTENESEHDLIEEDRYEFSNDSDDEGALGPSFDIAYRNEETGGEVNLTIQDNGGATANVESDTLFRNSSLPRIRRASSTRVIRNNSRGESRSSAASSSAYPASVNTNEQNSSPQIANSLDTRPRNNSFMFVLESNSGNRRRRILNLSYLDSYSEVENNQLQKKIHWNKKKLLGYVEECNVGRGFIKEVGFSSDGRLISSPYGYGLRIFGFDSHCNELCDCIPSCPVKLYEVTCSLAHANYVVASKFSPVHNMIVSGCLDGRIAFHQPVL